MLWPYKYVPRLMTLRWAYSLPGAHGEVDQAMGLVT